jgi:hypothetical protein
MFIEWFCYTVYEDLFTISTSSPPESAAEEDVFGFSRATIMYGYAMNAMNANIQSDAQAGTKPAGTPEIRPNHPRNDKDSRKGTACSNAGKERTE